MVPRFSGSVDLTPAPARSRLPPMLRRGFLLVCLALALFGGASFGASSLRAEGAHLDVATPAAPVEWVLGLATTPASVASAETEAGALRPSLGTAPESECSSGADPSPEAERVRAPPSWRRLTQDPDQSRLLPQGPAPRALAPRGPPRSDV